MLLLFQEGLEFGVTVTGGSTPVFGKVFGKVNRSFEHLLIGIEYLRYLRRGKSWVNRSFEHLPTGIEHLRQGKSKFETLADGKCFFQEGMGLTSKNKYIIV